MSKFYNVEVTKDCTIWRNQNGKLHREDGPAISYKDGSKQWYLNEKLYPKNEFNKLIFKLTDALKKKSHKAKQIGRG